MRQSPPLLRRQSDVTVVKRTFTFMHETAYSEEIDTVSPIFHKTTFQKWKKILLTRSRNKIMATFIMFTWEPRGNHGGLQSVIFDTYNLSGDNILKVPFVGDINHTVLWFFTAA